MKKNSAMPKPKPIKRAKELQPISREHHHGLLLSWKLRQALSKQIEINRVRQYLLWFWAHHLAPHFEFEETYIFPILGKHDKRIEQLMTEHQVLREMILDTNLDRWKINTLQKALTEHIRLEEREVFEAIQDIASPDQLAQIESAHNFIEDIDYSDPFWL